MRKFLKRLVFVAGLLFLALVFLAGLTFYMARRHPAIYKPYIFTAIDQRRIAKQAAEKFNAARAMAQALRAQEARQQNGLTDVPATQAPPVSASQTLEFDEEEVNAFLQEHGKATFEQYVKEPGIFLREGQIILAGEVKELGSVLSFHFEPEIDEKGRLKLSLVSSNIGRVSLPRAVLDSKLEKVQTALKQRLPGWQRSAKMDATGQANDDTVKAAMAKLLLNTLDDLPSEPVVFTPADDHKALPLLLREVEVKDKKLVLTLLPMNPAERQAAFEKIRQPELALSRTEKSQGDTR
jgi:hypothetical protein